LLRQHIAPGYAIASDLERVLSENDGAVTLITIRAAPLALCCDGEAITLGKGSNAPRIAGTPIIAGNDVIYCVDGIIPPPSRQ